MINKIEYVEVDPDSGFTKYNRIIDNVLMIYLKNKYLSKHFSQALLVFVLFISSCQTLKDDNKLNTIDTPSGLMIEFIRQPQSVSIYDSTPEFGWIVPQNIIFQSGYQILVASSEASIEDNIGDIWDSGREKSSASSNVFYDGIALQSDVTYYWKVRVWNQENLVSIYSEVQSFKVTEGMETLTTPNIFQMNEVKSISFEKLTNDSYFVDFGKDAFATLKINYQTNERDTIIVRIGEQLEGDKINRNPQGTIRYQEIRLTVLPEKRTYILPITPDERHTKPQAIRLPDSIPVILPFRYCELENVKSNLSEGDLTQLTFNSYWEDDQSSFHSSDTILNQVWDLCKYSIKATSFAGVYVDGDRERIPYEADAYLNQLSHYAVDREYTMARRTIEYFMEYPTWPTEWQLHVALMFYQDYMYTGNTELIEKYYDQLKHKTLMELAREDGLISSQSEKNTPEFMQKLGFKDSTARLKDIVDWPPAQKDTGWQLATAEGERDGFVFQPINTVINALYYKNLKIMAEFAGILNKPEEESTYHQEALKVKVAMNDKLFDEEKGVYVDGEGTNHASLHANMMPLAFGIAPDDKAQSVLNFIESRGMACSVYGSQYLLEALYEYGAADYALALMTATHDRSWWNMIAIGSTVTLEAWDMKYKPNSDWNHAWGAAPANMVARGLWGMVPKTPGGSEIKIKPQLSNLTVSSIEVPFLRGIVKASFEKVSESEQTYVFDLPANVSADLDLGDQENISVNGKRANIVAGIVRLSPGVNEVIVNRD